MRLQFYLIAFLVTGAFIISTSLMIAELTANTGTQVDQTYNETFIKINQTLNITNEAKNQLIGGDVEVSAGAGLLQLASFPILKLILNNYDIMIGIMNDTVMGLGLPSWIIDIVLGIILLLIIFAILYLFFGVKP